MIKRLLVVFQVLSLLLLAALAEAVAKNDPWTRKLWFDVTIVAVP